MPYDYRPYPYSPPPGLTTPEGPKPVIVIGAGPVGLAMALELAGLGVPVTVLDDNDVVSIGSRAICWSKRSLEIFARLGVGARALDKGVTWQVGRTYHRDVEVFRFDLLPEDGHRMPAFVNLQQYHVEEYLIEAALAHPLVDLRFRNEAIGIDQTEDVAHVSIRTPDGEYGLRAAWVVACDGARSPVRGMLGLDFEGELFEEHFLIADIEMQAEFPPDRRFWFAPPFHDGQSALLHKQPDDIYRIDLQLGWGADPEAEKAHDRVRPRIEKVVGHGDFRIDWVSVYTFQCRRLARFVHGRIVFAGDAAHVVSPFGARGGNSGLQDVDALGWRLAEVVAGRAGPGLLAAYDRERTFAADENIRESTRATRFLTPAPGGETDLRDAVLRLARKAEFARPMVNSGRLSVPCVYPVPGHDDARLPRASRPGAVAPDAPQGAGFLLDRLGGDFALVAFGEAEPPEAAGVRPLVAEMNDHIRARYLGAEAGACGLVRPDQVVAARWVGTPEPDAIAAELAAIREGRA
ncbi:MAG: FAD-dependent monooxygenase [Rhodobacteraceae bacterium]|nr:FAD-dependent monooxygenase [Paracoccaceae bacterium]